MADLDPNPKTLDQSYDLGFSDGMVCVDALVAENTRLCAMVSRNCDGCRLHELQPDLMAMERHRNIWRSAALLLWVPAVCIVGIRLVLWLAKWID